MSMSKSKGILESLNKGQASIEVFRHGRSVGIAFLALLPPLPAWAANSQAKTLPGHLVASYQQSASMAQSELAKLSSRFDLATIDLNVGEAGQEGVTPFARLDFANKSCTVHLNGMDVMVTYFYSHMDQDIVTQIPDIDEKIRYLIVSHEVGHCADMMIKQDNDYLQSIAKAIGQSIENSMQNYQSPPEIKRRVINTVTKLYGETYADTYAAISLLDYYRDRGEPIEEAMELIAEFASVRHIYGHVDEEHNSSFALKSIDAKAVPFDAHKHVMTHLDALTDSVVKNATNDSVLPVRAKFHTQASTSARLGNQSIKTIKSLKPAESVGISNPGIVQ